MSITVACKGRSVGLCAVLGEKLTTQKNVKSLKCLKQGRGATFFAQNFEEIVVVRV